MYKITRARKCTTHYMHAEPIHYVTLSVMKESCGIRERAIYFLYLCRTNSYCRIIRLISAYRKMTAIIYVHVRVADGII